MDELQRFWFPRKTYGWGWGLPCAWQGWAVLAAYLLIMIAATFLLRLDHVAAWLAVVVVATVALLAACWLKGEPPGGWHWGD
ncbi:MAG: hypothetical protein QM601_13900 [Pseudoxanthomonas sp.]